MAHAPQIEGLRLHQILEKAREFCEIDDYMPELNDGKLPNREFVVNIGNVTLIEIQIVNSLIPEELQEMIDNAMEMREEKYIKRKSITMKVLPKFKDLFTEVKEISSNRYSLNYFRRKRTILYYDQDADQRRRKKAEKLLNQHRENDMKHEMDDRDLAIEDLKQKIKDFE